MRGREFTHTSMRVVKILNSLEVNNILPTIPFQ
jgi:hypothetical protein